MDQQPASHTINLRFEASVKTCPVVITHDLASGLAACWRSEWREAAVIGDATVCQLYASQLAALVRPFTERVLVLDFPAGEAHKSRGTKEMLEDRLLAEGFSRQACIVALGGGISLDLAGYVAATYLRGVAHLNFPTSLLAQVDAAIGGKTGVNTKHGKNLIGAIHQPAGVILNSGYLTTLAAEEWRNGLAEMVKHAVIADGAFFSWLEAHCAMLAAPGALDPYPLRRCIEIKGQIVQQDQHELGLRSVLNLGHTVGHALEKATAHGLAHGHAVAIGMIIEGQVARILTGFAAGELERLRHVLSQLKIPLTPPPLSFAELVPFLGLDKKRKDGQLHMALPAALGTMATAAGGYTLAVPLAVVKQAWETEASHWGAS